MSNRHADEACTLVVQDLYFVAHLLEDFLIAISPLVPDVLEIFSLLRDLLLLLIAINYKGAVAGRASVMLKGFIALMKSNLLIELLELDE